MEKYKKDPALGWLHRCELLPRIDDTMPMFADHPGDGISDGIIRARLDGYLIVPMPTTQKIRNQICELAMSNQQRGEPILPPYLVYESPGE